MCEGLIVEGSFIGLLLALVAGRFDKEAGQCPHSSCVFQNLSAAASTTLG